MKGGNLEKIKLVIIRTQAAYTAVEEAILVSTEIPTSEVLFAFQCAHISQLKKITEIMQVTAPEGQRKTFAQYLRELADAEEKGGS